MRTLDLSRPYATVSPPYQIPGADRAQCFDQDGRPFDAHGQEIVLGDTPQSPAAPPKHAATAQHMGQLIANADKVSLPILMREAKIILGEGCPTKRADIVASLRARLTVELAAGARDVCEACGRPFVRPPPEKDRAA